MAKKPISGFDSYDFTAATDTQEENLQVLVQDPSYNVEKGWKVTVKQILQCLKPSFLAAKFPSVNPARTHSLASTSGLSTVGDILKLIQGGDFSDANFPAKSPARTTKLISPEGKVAISALLALALTTDVKNGSGQTVDALITALQTAVNGKAPVSHTHNSAQINSLDAAKLTGTIDMARLPAGAMDKLVTVGSSSAMLALTIYDVQNGDTVKRTDLNGQLFMVKDDSKLGSLDAFEAYSAARAASVPWSGVEGKPTDFVRLQGNYVPVGCVMMFAVEVNIDGWMYCDGRAVSRTAYAALFAMIGTTFGSGNGSTTFNIPNYKGVYPRFYGSRSMAVTWTDTANASHTVNTTYVAPSFNEVQTDAIRNISGYADAASAGDHTVASGAYTITYVGKWDGNIGNSGAGVQHFRYDFRADRIVPTNTENRPVSMSLYPCIRVL
ncbi:MAG: phage tail protein [Sphaerochaetaceae bacterium]|nr:phage tail protein [Sphaerochaetaceae bacterium]